MGTLIKFLVLAFVGGTLSLDEELVVQHVLGHSSLHHLVHHRLVLQGRDLEVLLVCPFLRAV